MKDLPVVGKWLGGNLYGTARNASPGGEDKKPGSAAWRKKESGSAFLGDQVMGP